MIGLDFAELSDFASVGTYYASEGLTFSENSVALRDRSLGGRGNFNSSDGSILTYTEGDAIEVGLAETLPVIVAGQLTLRYTSPHIEQSIRILDAKGNEIDRFILPRTPPNLALQGEFDNFQTLTFDFSGNARSLAIGSFAGQLGLDNFDLDLTFASDEPTEPTEPEAPTEPTEPTEPEAPLEPTEPTGPTEPEAPLEPTEPEAPTEPTEPTEPEAPLEPTEPTEPEEPTAPTEPTEPAETLNAAPIDILTDPSDLLLSEDAPTGTLVATLTGIDPDGDTLSFVLLDNADGQLALNDENQLVLADNSQLDFETGSELSITAQITDPGGLSYAETIPISITDVDETPPPPPNQDPVANDDTVNGDTLVGTPAEDSIYYPDFFSEASILIETGLLLANDSDPDGDSLSIVEVGEASNGSVELDSVASEVLFTPSEPLVFEDGLEVVLSSFPPPYNELGQRSGSFGYTASDGAGGTATAQVNVLSVFPQVLDGREGNDTLSFELQQFAPETPVEVDLSQANDQIMGDDLIVVGFENIEGSGFGDTFSGDDAPNVLTGQAGLDRLDGRGNNDRLIGGSDDDTLIGGLGSDVLTGGLGGDIFVFNTKTEGEDTISDFEGGTDSLAISAAGFGTDDFTAGVGLNTQQLQEEVSASGSDARFVWSADAGDVLLSFDPDGDGLIAPSSIARIAIDIPILTTDDFIVF